MVAASSLIGELRGSISDESARIQREFEATGDGRACVAQRTRHGGRHPRTALERDCFLRRGQAREFRSRRYRRIRAAAGCFLIPILTSFSSSVTATRNKHSKTQSGASRRSSGICELKLSPASRTLAECDRYDPNNTEFTISLLDCRYLAGDRDLFRQTARQGDSQAGHAGIQVLLQGLAEVTRERHGKYRHDLVPP